MLIDRPSYNQNLLIISTALEYDGARLVIGISLHINYRFGLH